MRPEEILFKLLNISLGGSSDFRLPESVEWRSVVDLSFMQDVAAFAVDGIQRVCSVCPDKMDSKPLCELDSLEYEDLKYEWFGQTIASEQEYKNHIEEAKNLAGAFNENGIRLLSLKGLSLCRFYPIPSHRSFYDLDCYLFGDFEKGNKFIEKLGGKVRRENSKHSVFQYKGLAVENHQYCIAVKGSKKDKELESYLKSLLNNAPVEYFADSFIELASYEFCYIFVLAHSLRHFLTDGLLLRHVCDWAMVLKNMPDGFDAIKYDDICEKFGLSAFRDAMNGLASLVCGVGENKATNDSLLILNDILSDHYYCSKQAPRWRQHIHIICQIWRNRWKYEKFTDRTALSYMLDCLRGHWLDRDAYKHA